MGKTFVYNTGKPKKIDGEIEAQFGLFFDGTLNNKDNTDLRKKKKKGIATPQEEKLYKERSKKSFVDDQGVDNSYSNDYSNVARQWKYCVDDYRIYIAGIGTISVNEEKDIKQGRDDSAGFQFGIGKMGIRAKVREGCELLAKKLKILKNSSNNKNKKLKTVTLDVFGFSRGATAARNFVHEVNVKTSYLPNNYLQNKAKREQDAYEQEKFKKQKEWEKKGGVVTKQDNLKSKPVVFKTGPLTDSDGEKVNDLYLKGGPLPRMGHLGYALLQNGFSYDEVEELDIVVRFLGVYDTVSSYYKEGSMTKFAYDQYYGKNKEANRYFADDVVELQLKNLGAVQKMVHFTAMDEHRYNFALTKLPGATEKQFPGVHCDIGGAYLTEKETVDEIEVGFVPSRFPVERAKQAAIHKLKEGFWGYDAKDKLKEFMNMLIEESWYKKNQLSINDSNYLRYNKTKIPVPSYYDKITGVRMLKKEYSYIPLQFMNEYFTNIVGANDKKVFSNQSGFKKSYSIDSHDVLVKAKAHLKPYVIDNKGNPWKYLSDEHIKLKNEILAKKKQKLMEKAKEEAIKAKRAELYPPARRDGYLEAVNRQTQMKGKFVEEQFNKRLDEMEERRIKMLKAQGVLEILRNEYFHWSANRDWFGMNPTPSRKRTKY